MFWNTTFTVCMDAIMANILQVRRSLSTRGDMSKIALYLQVEWDIFFSKLAHFKVAGAASVSVDFFFFYAMKY